MNNIVANVQKNFSKVKVSAIKHSPEICVAVGIVGVVASAVMACRATLKLNEVLEESKKDIDDVHTYVERNGYTEEYTEEDSKKDLAIAYTKGTVAVVKTYAPAVVLGAVSIASIVMSHKILSKRNAALAAAYTAVDTGFKEYRKRVADRFGDEVEKEIRYNLQSKEVTETVTDENGKKKKVKKNETFVDPELLTLSPYAKIFEEGCTGWTKDPEFNLMTVKKVENWANQKLKTQGYLFLNDVYDAFGFPLTKAGHVVGWIYDEENPIGDNSVDFGLYNLNDQAHIDFVNGRERNVVLDFNVDGNIFDYVW